MSNLTAQAARVVRPGWLRVPFQRAAVASHDIQAALPPALRATIAKGFLEPMFKQALLPNFVYPAQADSEPFQGRIGDKKTFTRAGLMTPVTTPTTPGSDAGTGTYNVEQWSVVLDRYGLSKDTDMLADATQMASQYIQDVVNLGANAGESLNLIARNKLIGTYAGGRTWITTTAGSDSTAIVNDVTGFLQVSVNGVLTDVSVTNPLPIRINGTANTVTAVNTGTRTLTLGTARADTVGDYVVADNAPVSVRPTGNSGFDLGSGNIATLALFRSATTRLRKMSVPDLGGAYTALVSHDTINQLFSDSVFLQAFQGRGESPVWGDLAIGRIAGIDFVPHATAPTFLGGTHASAAAGTLSLTRDIVIGTGALVASPFPGIDQLLANTGVEGVPSISMVNVAPGIDVCLAVRPPQDRYQTTVSTTWSWVGDYGVPTDLFASGNDAALYKRGVIVEHA